MYKKKSNRRSLPKTTSPHNYNNPQYYAQTFTEFLKDSNISKAGSNVGYKAVHRGDLVQFPIANAVCDITFMVKNYLPNSKLEVSVGEKRFTK